MSDAPRSQGLVCLVEVMGCIAAADYFSMEKALKRTSRFVRMGVDRLEYAKRNEAICMDEKQSEGGELVLHMA